MHKSGISAEQYGLVEDAGTRNAVFILRLLRMLSECAIIMQRRLYVCFID